MTKKQDITRAASAARTKSNTSDEGTPQELPATLNEVADEAHVLLYEAVAVMNCTLEDLDCDMAYGVRDLMQGCYERLGADGCRTALCDLELEDSRLNSTLAVFYAMTDIRNDRPVLWAALRLVEAAKKTLKEGIGRIMIEARHV